MLHIRTDFMNARFDLALDESAAAEAPTTSDGLAAVANMLIGAGDEATDAAGVAGALSLAVAPPNEETSAAAYQKLSDHVNE